jgi:hypothetical protein
VAQWLLGDSVGRRRHRPSSRPTLAGRLFLEAPPEREAFEVYGLLARGGRWFSKYEPAPALLFPSWKTLPPTALNPLPGALVAGYARQDGRQKDGGWQLLLCLSLVLGMSDP